MNLLKNTVLLMLVISYSSTSAMEQATVVSEQPVSSAVALADPAAHVPAVTLTPATMALIMNQCKPVPEHAAWAVWAKKHKSAVQLVVVVLLGYLAWSVLGASNVAETVAEGITAPIHASLPRRPLQNPSVLLRLLSIL